MASKKSRDEAEMLLSREGVSSFSGAVLSSSLPPPQLQVGTRKPIMEKKKERPETEPRSSIQVLTNVYPVQTKNIPIFRYDILITASYIRVDGSEAQVELTKKRVGGE